MKTLFKSLKITLAFCVFFSVFYILILWIFAQVAGPNKRVWYPLREQTLSRRAKETRAWRSRC